MVFQYDKKLTVFIIKKNYRYYNKSYNIDLKINIYHFFISNLFIKNIQYNIYYG